MISLNLKFSRSRIKSAPFDPLKKTNFNGSKIIKFVARIKENRVLRKSKNLKMKLEISEKSKKISKFLWTRKTKI